MRYLLLVLLIEFVFSCNCLRVPDLQTIGRYEEFCMVEGELKQLPGDVTVKALKLAVKAATKACCTQEAIDPNHTRIKAFAVLKRYASLLKDPVGFLQNEDIKELKEPTKALLNCLTTNDYVTATPPQLYNIEVGRTYSSSGSAAIDSSFNNGRY